ncbi:proteasome adapter and scaffold protein ECM29 isoform X4 [Haemaphysalis longicornis]
MAQANTPDETELMERVFLRFVTAETDEQFESVLSKFLLPVLAKLNSSQEGVRKKVMELLVHVNRRLKSRPQVQLPVEALLGEYGRPGCSSFVLNFALVYLRMGFPRLPPGQQARLLPRLLDCWPDKPPQHRHGLLQVAVGAVCVFAQKPPAGGQEGGDPLSQLPKVSVEGEAWSQLRDCLLDLLLLPYTLGGGDPPPGLSVAALGRLVGPAAPHPPPEELERRKLATLRLLAHLYPDASTVVHLLVASADTRHSVASAAETKLKSLTTDWSDEGLVKALYGLYLGSSSVRPPSGQQQQQQAPLEQQRTAADTRLRLKLLPCLVRSNRAASMLPLALMVTFDTLGSSTNAKLKCGALELIQAMCSNNPEEKLSLVGPQLLAVVRGLVVPAEEAAAQVGGRVRVLACGTLGHLTRKLPRLADLALVQALFDALAREEDGECRLALLEALAAVSRALATRADQDDSLRDLLLSLVTAHGQADSPYVRRAALGFAATVYPPHWPPARYLLLLAAGDSQEEIRREAHKALYPGGEEGGSQPPVFPPFPDMLRLVADKARGGGGSSPPGLLLPPASQLPWSRQQYSEVLRYLRRCLLASAGAPPDERCSPRLNRYLRSLYGDTGQLYAHLLVGFLPADEGPLVSLVELVAADKQVAALLEAQRLSLKGLLASGSEAVREAAAQLVGLVAALRPREAFLADLRALCTDIRPAEGGVVEVVRQSSLLVLAHALCRRHRAGLSLEAEDEGTADAVALLANTLLESQGASQWGLVQPSCVALGLVGAALALPLPPGQVQSTPPPATLGALVHALASVLHNTKAPAKCREEAGRTLGLLCLGQPHFPHVHAVLDSLLASGLLVESGDVEVHFTVGESLCCAVLGQTSPLCRDPWTTEEADFQPAPGAQPQLSEMQWLVGQLLHTHLCHPRPAARQAACVWTLSLLQRCSPQEPVRCRLQAFQGALLNLLADRSELTQSLASRGLSLLYELSDRANRDALVAQLLDTLASGRKSTVAVTEDTRLFDEGTLGSAPTGGSLTTYRELCSLATDLNQPDLMYKFMHLANHHALWNSKKGAAFGFGSIAEKAGEQLKEHLGRIVPKLYRYRYDPNPGVRASFGSIWAALVKDPIRTVDRYFKEILEDLMQHLTSNEWRVRESSCLALSDLLGGRTLDDVLDCVPGLWENLFRVRDDIKESVRKACESSLRAMTKACVQTCDAHASGRERALAVVLPCLARGLSSPVAEVRQTSLETLVQLSRGAGPALRPHLPLLLGALLDALSDLEPPVLSQLSVQADAEARDRVDAARVAASRTSPAMETINFCVQYVDASVLEELVPRLVEQSRSAVGLSTRAGCGHLATTLAHHCPLDLHPHAGKLLRAFVRGLGDRNATVRRSCTTTVGHLAKVAKDSDLERLMTKLRTWYLEASDDVTVQWSCAHTMQAVGRHAPDRLRSHAAAALPLAFLAKHAPPPEGKTRDESPAAVWEEIWTEFTTGAESGVRLYLAELCALVEQAVASGTWSLRRQGAQAACSLAPCLGWDQGGRQLLHALLAALPGRLWQGKESLLEALSVISTNCIAGPETDGGRPPEQQALLDQVCECLVRECRREQRLYREQAVAHLARLLEAHRVDRLATLIDLLEPALRMCLAGRPPGEGEEEEEEPWDLESQLRFQEVALEALGQAWPYPEAAPGGTQEKLAGRLCDLLLSSFSGGTWKVQLAAIGALHKFVLRLRWPSQPSPELVSMAEGVVRVSCQALEMTKYSSLCLEALKLLKAFGEQGSFGILGASTVEKLRHAVSAARDSPQLKSLAQDVASRVAVTTGH